MIINMNCLKTVAKCHRHKYNTIDYVKKKPVEVFKQIKRTYPQKDIKRTQFTTKRPNPIIKNKGN